MIFGCGKSQPPKAPDEVKLQLKWLHQAQFAGFYMAQEKGYYAKENIKVTFLEGGPDVDIAGNVISGKADFGVMTPEYILTNRSMGVPLTALAAIYRRSAVVFAARADSGIVRPSDFTGKTVAAAGQGGSMEFELQLRAMMKKLKQDISKVKIVPYDPTYANFYSGEDGCYSGILYRRHYQNAEKRNETQPHLAGRLRRQFLFRYSGDYRQDDFGKSRSGETIHACHSERMAGCYRGLQAGCDCYIEICPG